MVTQTLEARGVLNMVRAQLRAAVFTAVDEQEKALGVHTPNPDALRAAASADGALACALVVDFMRSFGMAQSLSVFGPESNLGEEAMAEAAAGGAPLAAKVTKATGLALPAATAGAAEPLLMQLLRAARGGAQTAMPSGTAAPASAAASGGGGSSSSSSSSSSSPANTQAAKTSPAASPASGTQRQQHLSPPTPPAGGAGAVEQQGDDTGGSAADEGYGDSDFEDEEEDGEISDALSVSDEILSIDEVSRSFNERSFSEAAAAGGGGMNGSLNLNASLDGSAALDRTLDRTLDSSRALDSYDFVEPVNTASPKSKR